MTEDTIGSYLRRSIDFCGRELILETGRLAKQAGGAVWVRYGDTVILATATSSPKPRSEDVDFLPLTVDYEERLYAVGRIPGGFIRREGRPTEKAILAARLIDRPLRPLFPKGFYKDVNIVVTVLSVDQNNPPEILGLIGASAALSISSIPFNGPVGAVNVGMVGDKIIINPVLEEMIQSCLKLTLAATQDEIIMVEAGANEVAEEKILKALDEGQKEARRLADFIQEFQKEALEKGLAKVKEEITPAPEDETIKEQIRSFITPFLTELIQKGSQEKWPKKQREEKVEALQNELWNNFCTQREIETEDTALNKLFLTLFQEVEKKLVRLLITEKEIRVDGRSLKEIRPIWCEVGLLPRTHGSALFNRGETQVLTVCTLGTISEEQILDGLGIEESKRYMHHYNFPPFSVGEARPIRVPSRREIGHGALAEKALEPLLPSEDEFPYTIRLVSEVLGSNGSTSMGSTCGSTLALMDAGVPIKSPVAGVAMGLIKEEKKISILTDIQGIEDALGDMDFKVAGTKKGITALQMDIKIPGINLDVLQKALADAREGRLFILEKMLDTIREPRPELSPYAPRILRLDIDPDKIRDVIGPGGKVIKKIIEETNSKIDIQDDGRIFIYATDRESANRTIEIIQSLVQDIEVGKVYTGTVTRTTDFGAFVEIIPGVLGLPGKEGLVHISQLDNRRVDTVEDIVKKGDKVIVKVIGFDPQGRLRLSRKEALYPEETSNEKKNHPPKNRSHHNKNYSSAEH